MTVCLLLAKINRVKLLLLLFSPLLEIGILICPFIGLLKKLLMALMHGCLSKKFFVKNIVLQNILNLGII